MLSLSFQTPCYNMLYEPNDRIQDPPTEIKDFINLRDDFIPKAFPFTDLDVIIPYWELNGMDFQVVGLSLETQLHIISEVQDYVNKASLHRGKDLTSVHKVQDRVFLVLPPTSEPIRNTVLFSLEQPQQPEEVIDDFINGTSTAHHTCSFVIDISAEVNLTRPLSFNDGVLHIKKILLMESPQPPTIEMEDIFVEACNKKEKLFPAGKVPNSVIILMPLMPVSANIEKHDLHMHMTSTTCHRKY